MFNTPIAIFTFNRPQLTERLLGILALIKPSRILVVSDGPRPHVASDVEKCAAVRRLFDNLDWECQVERNFAESNMGSFPRNSSGLTWVFDTVDEAIILEDDCLPELSFFPFCAELLERYRDEPRVGLISGDNFLHSHYLPGLPSYFFSGYATTWGWASWRRTWQQVDLNMPYWPEFRDSGALGMTVGTIEEEKYWRAIYDEIQGKIKKNAWDYQLILTCMKFRLLTIVPAVNLVSNVGFGVDATNCFNRQSPLSNTSVHELPFPLCHPTKITSSTKIDYLIFNRRFGNNHWHRLSNHMPRLANIMNLILRKSDQVKYMNLMYKLISKLPVPVNNHLRRYWRASKKFAIWMKVQTRIAYMKLKRRIIAAPVPVQAEGKLFLHLGCGAIVHNKFINIDSYPFPHIHYVQSIDKLPQFDDASVDLIYASHCLEHFSYFKTKSVLEEWFRVLKKGAVLRLSVPDFDKMVEIYTINNHDPDVILPQLMGGQENKYNFHLTALNNVNLSRLLRDVGFNEVRAWQPGTDDLTTFDDFSIYKIEIGEKLYELSLNIEAIK